MSSMTLGLGVGAGAGALALLGWAVAVRPDPAAARIRRNLGAGFDLTAAGDRAARVGLVDRIARMLTPVRLAAALDQSLALAGRPPAWPLVKLLKAKLVLGPVGAGLGVLWVRSHPAATHVLLAAVVTVVCYFVPDLLIKSTGQKRQATIGLELADTLDQMSIAVAAGLGFESAMLRSAKNGKGPLAEELTRTLQDMQFGLSRREAYLSLAARTTVADLRRFLRAVIQADVYGVAITDVLRTQAAEMRLKRRQRAETKAMQIPVKVIFPLMLCILPTLFIVLLGPAAINIMSVVNSP